MIPNGSPRFRYDEHDIDHSRPPLRERIRARRATRQAAQAAAFVDEVAEQAMRPGLRVVRPEPSPWGPVWDATVDQHGEPEVRTTGFHALVHVVREVALDGSELAVAK